MKFMLKAQFIFKTVVISQLLIFSMTMTAAKPAFAEHACPESIKAQIRYNSTQIVRQKLLYVSPAGLNAEVQTCTYAPQSDVATANVWIGWKHYSEQIYYTGRLEVIQSARGTSYSLIRENTELTDHMNRTYPFSLRQGWL